MNGKKTTTAYWNQGGYYLEDEPHLCHWAESNMFRRADELGYTHVETKHGYYQDGQFQVRDIPARLQRIPKRYRRDA